MPSKSARWCFTVNNPGPWRPAFDAATMEYLIWELEHATEAAGTPHIQGYVVFKVRKLMGAAKAAIAEGAHMEIAKGSEQQNKDYCSKEPAAEHAEHGTFDANRGMQGSRTDISACTDKLKAGQSLQKVAMEHPTTFVKFSKGLTEFAERARGKGPLIREVHTTVLWGPSGSGKSHRVMTSFGGEEGLAYYCKAGKNCMDKYEGEEILILDEFEADQVTPQELNRWLDKWPCQLEARYNNKIARWTSVYILSNTDPVHWFSLHPPQVQEAVLRRLSEPMGRVFHVEDRETPVDLTWWSTPVQPLPVPAPIPPTPTPVLQAPAAPARDGDSPPPRPLKRARAVYDLTEEEESQMN